MLVLACRRFLYRHNYLTVTLTESRLAMCPEGASAAPVYPINAGDTRFFIGGAPIGVRNEGRTKYRNTTVEFLDPHVTNYGYHYYIQGASPGRTYGMSASAPPADPRAGFVHPLDLQKVLLRDVRLLPGEQLSPPDRPGKELVIAVTDLRLASAGDGELKKLPGEIAWIKAAPSSG